PNGHPRGEKKACRGRAHRSAIARCTMALLSYARPEFLMITKRLPWQEELAIIDRTMKAISGITDPEELVSVYWNGIGELIAVENYVAFSRRGEPPPYYRFTRS